MSRKLLLCNGKVIGYVYDETVMADYAEGLVDFSSEEKTPVYNYGYLLEAKGKTNYPGSNDKVPTLNFHKVATFDEERKQYRYTIVSTSSDGKQTRDVDFYLPHLLDEIDRTGADVDPGVFTDRLYWDEAKKEYMLEMKTAHQVYKNSDGWIINTGNGNIINIELDTGICVYPSGASTSKPCIKSNYYVVEWSNRIAMNGSWNQRTLSWVNEDTLCYGHMLGMYPEEATKEQLDALFVPEMHVVYAVETQVIPTGIKRKIKVPLFGNGTKFALKNYDTVFSGNEITGEQLTYGSIKIEVPCTDSIIYEYYEGTTITPSFSSDTHAFWEDESVYLEEVIGTHTIKPTGGNTAAYVMNDIATIGTPTGDGKYEYVVTATSADGTKSKKVDFILDYQLIHYGEPNKMYWNEELGCYDILLHSGYEYVTNVIDWGTTEYGVYTIFTKETDDGYIAYGTGNSDAIYVNGTFTAVGRNSLHVYKHAITTGSDQNNSTLGLCIHDIHTAEDFNAVIEENTPIHIYYEYKSDKIIHTNIKKKIKLPWYGEGTTYTMTTGELSPTFKIGLPTKFEHKIAYKEYKSLALYNKPNMLTNRIPTIKDIESYDIAYSSGIFIQEIEGTSWELPEDNGDGTYNYYIQMINNTINPDTGGAVSTVLHEDVIKLPYLLSGYFYNADRYGRDRLYWDENKKQYVLEQRIYRMYIDTAYGDVEFRSFSNSSASLDAGNCWEFAIPQYIYDHIHHPTSSTGNLMQVAFDGNVCNGYYKSAMSSAYSYRNYDGVVFAPATASTFEGYSSLVFYQSKCYTLDQLDAQLKAQPLIIELPLHYYYYGNQPSGLVDTWYGEPNIIPTGIKKKIKLPFTKNIGEKGVSVVIRNNPSSSEAIHAISTIQVPIEYKMIEVPEPTYQLPAKTVLTGTSSGGYIDTKVKLFDTAKDSTVIFDFESVNDSGSFTPENGDIAFHCRYENSSYKYRGFALVYETTYNSWRMMGNTTYNNGNLGAYDTSSISNASSEVYNWRYRYAFIFKAGILDRAINLSAETISSVDIPAPAKFFDEKLFSDKAAYASYSGTAYIGRKGTSSSNYFQGTIHDCKIWDGVALTDEQIQALYCRAYPKASYTISDSPLKIHTGIELFDIARDFTIAVNFTPTQATYTQDKVVISCGVYGDNVHRFALMYVENLGGYALMGSGRTVNILGTDVLIPQSPTGEVTLFIIYKNGVPSEVVDYSSGVYRSLEIASGLPAYSKPSLSLPLTIGYQQYSTNDKAGNHDACWVWNETIGNCTVWKDKALDKAEIEYVYKYVLN